MDVEAAHTANGTTMQDDICTIPGVRAARVVSAPNGRISEIHVVADEGKSAKQVVRDIQTLAQARHGLQIDYRIVSVVQLSASAEAATAPIPLTSSRPVLASIRWEMEGNRTTCAVELRLGEQTSRGEASGAATAHGRLRLAASATADALHDLDPHGTAMDVADVQLNEFGVRRVAVVVLLLLSRWGEQVLAGAAVVRADEADAVVRAVLDAANRRLWAPSL